MKTFAEMLNDPARQFTQDMRDAVEWYRMGQEEWNRMGCEGPSPYDLMRSTPPAKEPVSVESAVRVAFGGGYYVPIRDDHKLNEYDRVRVVKIEEST